MYYLLAEPCLATRAACTDICPIEMIGQILSSPDGSGRSLVGSGQFICLEPGECSDCTACLVACPVLALTH